MKTAFDPANGTWKLRWPGRVTHHDPVCLTPPTNPIHGIPLWEVASANHKSLIVAAMAMGYAAMPTMPGDKA